MDLRPIDPVTIRLTDGQERKLLLTVGGLRRLKQRFGVKTLKEMLEQDVVDVGIPMLYEALLDKGALTEDQFADMVPAHLDALGQTVAALITASFPKPDPRPTEAASIQ